MMKLEASTLTLNSLALASTGGLLYSITAFVAIRAVTETTPRGAGS